MAIDPVKEVEQMYAKKDYVKENKFKAEVQREVKQAKTSLMDKGVHISFRTMFFSVVLVLLISGSFLTGRYVFPSTGDTGLFAAVSAFWESDATNETASDAEVEEVEVAPVEESTPEEIAESAETAATEEAEATEAVEETPEVDPASQSVITTYNNVVLEFTRTPVYEWKGDEDGWGKIETIYYTVKNNENGIIKPASFHIIIEGYESNDQIKKVDVPQNTEEISAGKVVQNAVDKLVTYSNTVTDPTNIKITLQLFDASDVMIATATQEFNLT